MSASSGAVPRETRRVRIPSPPLLFILFLLMVQRLRPGRAATEDPRSDEELYRSYAEGDGGAFRVLLDRHGNGVHGYLARYLGDDEMAQDVAQDAFVRVIRGAADFRGESSFRTYLFTLARHAAIDALRGRNRRPDARAASLEAPAGTSPDDTPLAERLAVPDRGDHRTLSGELSAALEAGLAQLPDAQREAFLLREVEGLTFPEIGAIQGVPLDSARSRVVYAIRSLRRSLAGFGGQP